MKNKQIRINYPKPSKRIIEELALLISAENVFEKQPYELQLQAAR